MSSSPVMRLGLPVVNGKRPLGSRAAPPPPPPATTTTTTTSRSEPFAPSHDDNVLFIHKTWVQVEAGMGREGGAQRYADKDSGHNPHVANFTPVDLELLLQKREPLPTEKH
ncbi:mapk-regulated corepressor-interacting protein 1 isoform X1 [Petromyzon marinus]|uniref:mapk-regulated corepressor-interacting protein 1 isoform X1 n=2 Tax=Petromyzon marinus TaxID=7757 RepID=UPI003F6FF5ED